MFVAARVRDRQRKLQGDDDSDGPAHTHAHTHVSTHASKTDANTVVGTGLPLPLKDGENEQTEGDGQQQLLEVLEPPASKSWSWGWGALPVRFALLSCVLLFAVVLSVFDCSVCSVLWFVRCHSKIVPVFFGVCVTVAIICCFSSAYPLCCFCFPAVVASC